MFTRERLDNIPRPTAETVDSLLSTVQVTAGKVRKKIQNLRSEAAAGPDGIGPLILKELSYGLSPILAHVFSRSLLEGKVPQDWKEANVTPICKKGAKSDAGNYRPVSLTSVSCKMLESIMKDSICEHLEANNLIRPSQHGFTKGRSCVTNLLEFLEKVTTAVDGGSAYDVVYLDFSKAFDKVPRERLLKKVHAHGIRGQVLMWITEWLTGRKQRVVLNGKFSSWCDVLSGVPQGSVLGPLLFLLYINDLDEEVNMIDLVKKFADDTKIGQSMATDEDRQKLVMALRNLHSWAETWGMEFNAGKCKVMHFGINNPRHQYSMGGQVLETTEEEKDIGMVVTSNLKPSRQCAKAASTAAAVLSQISRAFHYRDRNVFVNSMYAHTSSSALRPGPPGQRRTLLCLRKYR